MLVLSLALIKPLLVGIPVTALVVTGGLYVFYPEGLGLDVKGHVQRISSGVVIVEIPNPSSGGNTTIDGDKKIKCKVGSDSAKVACSIKKLDTNNSKKWSDLTNIKGGEFTKTVNTAFFSGSSAYALRFNISDYEKVSFDASSTIEIIEDKTVATGGTETTDTSIRTNLKPLIGIGKSISKMKGKTNYFLAKASEFISAPAGSDNQESPQTTPTTFTVDSKTFKCSIASETEINTTCSIYGFSGAETNQTNSSTYKSFTLESPSTAATTIDLNKHYLVKMGEDTGGGTDITTLTADKKTIFTDVYETGGSTKVSTGVTQIKFKKMTPVLLLPTTDKTFAFVLK